MHVYRWDLDKTYLETDFDSIRSMVRTATEPAHAKKAVPGASALVRALGQREGARVFILSGSPTQLRAVLEEKLRLDGVQYETLVLKDNLGNLRRGRIRAIRGQLGYKLPVLLQSRAGLGPGVGETLFGDDAESDALIYSIYADAIAGRVTPAEVSRILEASGAYPDNIDAALEGLAAVQTCNPVDRIFIRLSRAMPPGRFDALGARLVPVYSWWQAALVLVHAGHIGPSAAAEVLAEWGTSGELSPWAAAGQVQDLLRRGHLPPEAVGSLEGPAELRAAIRQAVQRLGPLPSPVVALPPTGSDYLALVRQWGAKVSPA